MSCDETAEVPEHHGFYMNETNGHKMNLQLYRGEREGERDSSDTQT